MKSIVMAGWLLTTAIGNIIVAVIAESQIFSERWIEFFFFAGLMGVFIVIFMGFTFNYRYVEDESAALSASSSSPSSSSGGLGLGVRGDDEDFPDEGLPGGRRRTTKEERRRLMRDDRYDEGVIIDAEEQSTLSGATTHRSKREGYDPIDA